VTTVLQKDVPIQTEAVGTTVGFVNAQVMPRVQGYLLKQAYQDGGNVKASQLLFEIDDRPYKAALARRRPARAAGHAKHQLDARAHRSRRSAR
jgi:membrane fusion protein (multidrug efflux system)